MNRVDTPFLSIVVPVYNVEKYIHQCIDSILKQDFKDYELIIVDDGSPDNCPQICDEYSRKDARITVIHKENGGVSNARNTGIEHSNGKYIYFVDSDDWLEPYSLKKLCDIALVTNADVVFTDCIERFESGKENRVFLFSKSFTTSDKNLISQIQKAVLCHKKNPFFVQGADNAYPAPWSKLIKREIVISNSIRFDPYVKGVYDDGLFTEEVLEHTNSVSYSKVCTYNYRILTSSIVHAFREDMVEKFEKNCEKMNDFISKYNKGQDFILSEYARRIAYLSSFMSAYYFSEDNTKSKKEVYEDLKNTLNKSPWKEAITNVKIGDLENKHKYMLMCMKLHLFAGCKLYSKAKKIKQNSI